MSDFSPNYFASDYEEQVTPFRDRVLFSQTKKSLGGTRVSQSLSCGTTSKNCLKSHEFLCYLHPFFPSLTSILIFLWSTLIKDQRNNIFVAALLALTSILLFVGANAGKGFFHEKISSLEHFIPFPSPTDNFAILSLAGKFSVKLGSTVCSNSIETTIFRHLSSKYSVVKFTAGPDHKLTPNAVYVITFINDAGFTKGTRISTHKVL
jgi:hypothetical protein